MPTRTLVHLSDLHLGHSAANDEAVARLVDALWVQQVDHVVVTGDLTHRGRLSELEKFHHTFAPLAGRLTVVPGNHDRGTDDAAALVMENERVNVVERPDLFLVRVDSTAPHNKAPYRSHGKLCQHVLEQVDLALSQAQPGQLRAVLLHHHPLPLPEETFGERFASFMGWPFAQELPLGAELLERVAGRCDLVLHGHRHIPQAIPVKRDARLPLWVYNAGSSPELNGFRVFTHAEGKLLVPPQWQFLSEVPALVPVRAPAHLAHPPPTQLPSWGP